VPGLTISVIADVKKAIQGLDQVSEKSKGFGDTMKGVAGAVGGYLSLNQAQKWATEWINAAKDSNKAAKGVSVVFGESASTITNFATTSANALGMTQTQAERYAVTIGNQLKGYGLNQKDAAKGSVDLTKRAADMAYVLGTDVSTVLSAMGSALKGRTGGLKALGVNIDSNTVKERLNAKGLGDLTGEQATAAQATEILALMMEKTGDMAGVLSKKTDDTATSLPALKASIEDTKASLGQALLPALNTILPVLNDFAQWAEKHPALMQAVALAVLALSVAVGIFGIAMAIAAIEMTAALWWVVAIIAAIAALTVVIIIVIKYWDTLVGWFKTAWQWISNLIDNHKALALMIGGPVAAAILVIKHFSEIWSAVKAVVDTVWSAIQAVVNIVSGPLTAVWAGVKSAVDGIKSAVQLVVDLVNGAFTAAWNGVKAIIDGVKGAVDAVKNAAQGVVDKINSITSAPGKLLDKLNPFAAGATYASGAPGPSTSAATGGGGSVVINIAGDVADPVVLGRRIVAALDAYTSANGRRRLAELVNGSGGGPVNVRA
jgi:hypothetical protein